jgi:dolichol-phosphate mannosyltransferase
MNASVVLPTYNEKENIKKLILLLETSVFPKLKGYKSSILIVDDNSQDGTLEEVSLCQKKYKNIFVLKGKKEGLGAAYFRGFSYAAEKLNADILVSMDADMQHDPVQVTKFVQKLSEGHDLAVGSRYIKDGSIPGQWEWYRKILSRWGNFFIQVAFLKFYIHDWTGAYRAMKTEVFLKEKEKIKLLKGNTLLIALLREAIKDNYKVCEIPIQFVERPYGSSKILPSKYMKEALQYVIISSIQSIRI